MKMRFNPYNVICIGEECKLHDKCDKICILKSKFKNYLKGCNYGKHGDCKKCSHKQKCIILKPYSEALYKIEVKRNALENENKKLHEYISTWDEIENNLDTYGVDSVTEVVYFERNKQQMVERIKDNEKLINAYLKKEKKMI